MTTTLQAHAAKNFQSIKHFAHIQRFEFPMDLNFSRLHTSQCFTFLMTGLFTSACYLLNYIGVILNCTKTWK
jgi:hypothetical protein